MIHWSWFFRNDDPDYDPDKSAFSDSVAIHSKYFFIISAQLLSYRSNTNMHTNILDRSISAFVGHNYTHERAAGTRCLLWAVKLAVKWILYLAADVACSDRCVLLLLLLSEWDAVCGNVMWSDNAPCQVGTHARHVCMPLIVCRTVRSVRASRSTWLYRCLAWYCTALHSHSVPLSSPSSSSSSSQ